MRRVALFVLFLAAAGAAAAGVGSLVGDGRTAGASGPHTAHMQTAEVAEGLTSGAAGYTLEAARTRHSLRLQIRDHRGESVRDVLLHVIVVRRDLDAASYRHLHPTQQRDGSWLAPLRLESGVVRAFADFEAHGRKIVLGQDLVVGRTAAPRPLRATARAHAGPYAVRLSHGELRAGEDAELRFSVAGADGFQTYVGARGHLVALHAGDLAYAHVHPTGGSGGDILFGADFVRAGTYRLFLQFKRDDRVYTAPFVVEVAR